MIPQKSNEHMFIGKRHESEPSSNLEEPITPPKKQKQETSPTETRRKKGLCVNGRVDVEKYVYIEQEYMKERIQARIENGEFCILIAPSQSGKTSFVRNTLIAALEEGKYCPIFVDMRDAVSDYKSSKAKLEINFIDCIIRLIVMNTFASSTENPPTSLQRLFSPDADVSYFCDKKVVLIFDEIDSMAEIDVEFRKIFLAALSAMKQNKELYCLHSCLVITNWVGEYFGQTIGNSPFNVTNPIIASYFSMEEANLFWDEYEKEKEKSIEKEIRKEIYQMTIGAQGQTVMMTLIYDSMCGNEKSISIKRWCSEILSKEFWVEVLDNQNFIRITSVLSDQFIASSLLNWILNKKKKLELPIVNTLVKSNILKIVKGAYDFASPFVQKYVLDCLISKSTVEPLNQLPILENGYFDFITLLKAVLCNMDRNSIIVGSDRKQNHFDGSCSRGPKEILYQTAFEFAVQELLDKYFVKITQQKASKNENEKQKQCDTVISLLGFTILVEHCSNVSIDRKNDVNTLEHHIVQAMGYSTGVKDFYQENCSKEQRTQTYLLHWTNVPSTKKTYEFPESGNVKIIYIYHDELFSNIQIVTEDNVIPITIPIKLKISNVDIPKQLPQMQTKTLQRDCGNLLIGTISLDKSKPKSWSKEQVKMVLLDRDIGVGFDEDEILNIRPLNGHNIENIVDALVLFEGDGESKIDHAVNKFSIEGWQNNKESLVRWVYKNMLV